MKYLFTCLLGMLLGAAAALALLYVNPLSVPPPTSDVEPGWTLVYELPQADPAIWTDGGLLGLPRRPAAIDQLWEDTIRRAGLGVYGLKSVTQGEPVAAATRISVPHPDSDLLLHGALLSDYWLLTVPGQGSLFLHLDNNIWPFLKEVWVPVRYLNREWHGPATYASTEGPSAAGAGLLIGASGQFEGLRAAAHEQFELVAFDRQRHQGIGRLRLELDTPALPVVAPGD
jgi:hypothetical protein